MISYDDFLKVEIHTGTVTNVENFPEARKPAYKLTIDFGPTIGIKKSSVQITQVYSKDSLIGKQIMAVTNFPEKQIGPFKSEVLVLGVANEAGHVVLVRPDNVVPNGQRLH